ncbi:MAG: hypothetical protein DHS20C16_32530 [Phycisphaerae bacterium]|nr:MAG: hypothetical protein DHS20C16_32530 [Phycisphaerae bacterium]
MRVMRILAGMTLVTCLGTSNVLATATAMFNPTTSTSVLPGEVIEADISIEMSASSYDFARIVVGTIAPVNDLSFVFDSDWTDGFDDSSTWNTTTLISPYALAVEIDSFGFSVVSFDPPIALGTIAIDTTSMPAGTYQIGIDSDADDMESQLFNTDEGGDPEMISGGMSFTVLPEPVTALMMLAGGILLTGRSRK